MAAATKSRRQNGAYLLLVCTSNGGETVGNVNKSAGGKWKEFTKAPPHSLWRLLSASHTTIAQWPMGWIERKKSKIFQNVGATIPKCGKICQNVPKYSKMLQTMPKCSKMLQTIPKCSKLFQKVPNYSRIESKKSKMFQTIQKCSKQCQNIHDPENTASILSFQVTDFLTVILPTVYSRYPVTWIKKKYVGKHS